MIRLLRLMVYQLFDKYQRLKVLLEIQQASRLLEQVFSYKEPLMGLLLI